MKRPIFFHNEEEFTWLFRLLRHAKKTNPALASIALHALVLIFFSLSFTFAGEIKKKIQTIKIRNVVEERKYFEKKEVEVPEIKEIVEFSEDPGAQMELLLKDIAVQEKPSLLTEEKLAAREDQRGTPLDDSLEKPVDPKDICEAVIYSSNPDRFAAARLHNNKLIAADKLRYGSASAFFGKKVGSKRIIFIIDVSGSMGENTTCQVSGKAGIYDRKSGKYYAQRRKIYLALDELTKCVSGMNRLTKFNILAYSDKISKPFSKMVFATPRNIRTAMNFIAGLSACGGTDTESAFKEAFKDIDADTISLLSDGSPTTGAFPQNKLNNLSSTQIYINGTLTEINKNNRKRKLEIHTFSFENAASPSNAKPTKPAQTAVEIKFMKDLAKQNKGKYTPIK